MTKSSFDGLDYTQSGKNTCVIASYGAAFYPFTKQQIPDYFSAYCKFYNCRGPHLADVDRYLRHFNEQDGKKVSGFYLIEKFHRECSDAVIDSCRNAASLCGPFEAYQKRGEHEQTLINNPDKLLIVSYSSVGGYHSVVVFYDDESNSVYCFDTNTGVARPLPNFVQIPSGHAFFVTKKVAAIVPRN